MPLRGDEEDSSLPPMPQKYGSKTTGDWHADIQPLVSLVSLASSLPRSGGKSEAGLSSKRNSYSIAAKDFVSVYMLWVVQPEEALSSTHYVAMQCSWTAS